MVNILPYKMNSAMLTELGSEGYEQGKFGSYFLAYKGGLKTTTPLLFSLIVQ